MKHALIIISVLFSLTGCAAALVGGAAAGGYYLGQEDRPAGQVISDGAITSGIKTRMIADRYVQAFDIKVSTYEGTVTLSGEVDTYIAKQQAETIARRSKGVVNVINSLSVNADLAK